MKLRFAPAAVEDLRNLRSYLSEEFGATVAQQAIERLVADISSLKDFPGLMRPLAEKVKRATEYKYFLCGKCSVAILIEDDDLISVMRIFDERSDYVARIFGDRND